MTRNNMKNIAMTINGIMVILMVAFVWYQCHVTHQNVKENVIDVDKNHDRKW